MKASVAGRRGGSSGGVAKDGAMNFAFASPLQGQIREFQLIRLRATQLGGRDTRRATTCDEYYNTKHRN